MPSVSSFVPFVRWVVLALCVAFSAPIAAGQGPQTSTCGPCYLSGTVSDAETHARLDGARLDLQSTHGPSVETFFSGDGGRFVFSRIPAGSYVLVVDLSGYQSVSQQVDLFNDERALQIELRRAADANTKGPNTVSVRDLSIPRKAHDQMEKGLALLYGKSDYQGSLKSFEKAIEEYPDYYEAYAQIGVAYMKLADTANSEKAFQKSIEVSHEKYQDAYLGLAELSLNGHHFADAETFSRNAVEIDPNSWRAQSQLARALVELHRASEAEPSAVAAVKLRPDNATLYLVLANIHMQLQNDRALLDDLNQYLKLAPKGAFAEQARRQRDELQKFLSTSKSSPTPPSPTPAR
ncbi:MAG TPA: carboxypeptidase regulatory-like domain-containing protein [Candidatus Acidoferrales bacterium]